MERTNQKQAVINLVILLAAGLGAAVTSLYCRVLSGQVASGFLLLGVLLGLISWFQMRLEERERVEKLEFDEVSRGGTASTTIFQSDDAEAFPARRSREQFERFFIPAFTLFLLLAEAAAAFWGWRWLGRMPVIPAPMAPFVAMSALGLAALVLFLLGQYSTGLGRLEQQRLLRPAASAQLLGAYSLAAVVAALIGVQAGFPGLDHLLARTFVLLLGALAVESLLVLLLELYRPRLRGGVTRLLYESRLIGLLSHPEGLFTTLAHTLDYQFGFKVSETWFYQFLRRSAAALALAYLAILTASTCLVYVGPGEQALLERFGQPVPGRTLLGPGFHLKLPWPVDRAHRHRTEEIQQFEVGSEHEKAGPDDDGHGHGDQGGGSKQGGEAAVLWTVSHYKEEFHLLVASRETADSPTNNVTGKRAPPVNLLAVGVPVQFQVVNLTNWAYRYSDAAGLLKQLATREVVRYLVGVDVNEIMSTARFTAGEELRRRIQARADELQLGTRILFVGLQDVHPPVAVGAAYEKVVGSKQRRDADILRAQADATRTNALAQSAALRRRLAAEAQSVGKVAAAAATEALFTNQIAAFRASPEVYPQRAYLQALARHGDGARKFILATTNAQEILLLNMEDKLRDDLQNILIPAPRK
ncbi:MAG: hypothetical protein RJA22_2438 [Verrucomicrobiota bacterium]